MSYSSLRPLCFLFCSVVKQTETLARPLASPDYLLQCRPQRQPNDRMPPPMSLQLFNVLGREKQPFAPLDEGRVGMYVCGPTVYEHSHLGHAKTYVSFDVVARYLRWRGYDLLYVQNITDVGHLLANEEDRVLARAAKLNAKPMQVVETYTRSYMEDMDALGVQRPDISPRASGHVPEQIEMIETLLSNGHAYVADGNVFFDVLSAPDYGKLSNRRVEEQQDESRELAGDGKRNPADFALWRKAEPEHIMRWKSPGALASPAGISNARQWRRSTWAQTLISTAAASTISIRTTKTKSSRANAPITPPSPITGS